MRHLVFTVARGLVTAVGFLTIPVALAAQQGGHAGSIVGTVSDSASGLPIVAAEVRLGNEHHVDRTHENGGFQFTGLAAGKYQVTVAAAATARPRSRSMSAKTSLPA